MPSIPRSELNPSVPQLETPRQEDSSILNDHGYDLSTMMITDYRLSEDDPGRYTAVIITPEQMAEICKPENDQLVQYDQWAENVLLFSTPMTATEAKPFYFAANSSFRGSANNEQAAQAEALKHLASELGIVATGGNGRRLPRQ